MKPLRYSRLFKLWDQVHSSYWFIPTLMVALSAMLAFLLILADQHYVLDPADESPWLFPGEADSARVILSTIATVMMTVVSLTFSITIVVLTLASSQFGPRLIYNFMRDRKSQVALGLFLACFVFCLLILRSVQSAAGGGFVPQLGTSAAMLFALVSVGMLIFYIHHIADSIHASRIIANVRNELEMIVTRLLPERSGSAVEEEEDRQYLIRLMDDSAVPVPARERGVLQAVEETRLVTWAEQHDLFIRLNYRPGQFVLCGATLFDVSPSERVPKEQLDDLQDAFRFGHQRTLVQDIEFPFQQLVEIALRALSPGINDPYTATSCLDELGSGLVLFSGRGAGSTICRDKDGKARVLLQAVDFTRLTDTAFVQIRQSAAVFPTVMMHMLKVIGAIAPVIDDREHDTILRRHAIAIHAMAVQALCYSEDRHAVDACFRQVMSQLDGGE
ncbi:DUF2254 domain-containing protein [Sedimenticola thiotaurini]|uniref:DUF2254 domain-containing protein n=1 Tax=Sedimenticola thiotaurini TaxID=1543721 RepID=A0A0F7JWN6_9GAMM|nr:DUF2254 domain-containing protein [Sedimenticola thiotaurini]AKH19779.1 hypothetical protein AAY24_04745 [Sedimenticola thiotaurini]